MKLFILCLVIILGGYANAQSYTSSHTGTEVDSVVSTMLNNGTSASIWGGKLFFGYRDYTPFNDRKNGKFVWADSLSSATNDYWGTGNFFTEYSGTTSAEYRQSLMGDILLSSPSGDISGSNLGGIKGAMKITSLATQTYGDLSGVWGEMNWASSNNSATNIIGVKSEMVKTGTGDLVNSYGFWAQNWESVGGSITNYYAYYSRGALGSAPTNQWHFYGLGNSPSWFGGACNALNYNYFTDVQANDTYVVTLKGAHTLVAGLEITFKANTANTDGATVNVNGLGAKALTKASLGAINTALATGDILAGQIVKAVYDGTQFQIISRLAQ